MFLDGAGTTVGGTAGADNMIANNGLAGVRVNSGTGHAVLRNSIFGNGALGIDLGTGGRHGERRGGRRHRREQPAELPGPDSAVTGGVPGHAEQHAEHDVHD